jgi:spermidine synthase
VLGDARLSLEREEPQKFDVLVLDAFSGDAIPAHLLSREAIAVYNRHMAPGGTICVHVTNTYLDLAPIVRDLAAHHGYRVARIETEGDNSTLLYTADWMLLTTNNELIASLKDVSRPKPEEKERVVVWTDHNSNLFEILK